MQRFRSTWMALMAGALLVTLSVSAAFGAAPTSTEGNRGQSIASFVHELIFGTDEPEEDLDDEVTEEEELVEEDEELVEADEEELDEEAEEANAHGQCVAEEASDKSDEVDEDGNHGAVVSEAARDTCWETDEEDESDEVVEEEDEDAEASEEEDEESESHGACVSAAAQDRDGSVESELKNHGKWVSQHARYTCWGLDVPGDDEEAGDDETSDADEATTDADGRGKPDKADKADHAGGKPSWAGQGGNGKGRGGGRR